jgi:hypothetical protein
MRRSAAGSLVRARTCIINELTTPPQVDKDILTPSQAYECALRAIGYGQLDSGYREHKTGKQMSGRCLRKNFRTAPSMLGQLAVVRYPAIKTNIDRPSRVLWRPFTMRRPPKKAELPTSGNVAGCRCIASLSSASLPPVALPSPSMLARAK